MSNTNSTDTNEEVFRASPRAIEAGYLVEVDGEILITPKGLEELKRRLGEDGMLPIKGS